MTRFHSIPVTITSVLRLIIAFVMIGAFVAGSNGCAGKKKTSKTQQVAAHDDQDQLLKAKGQLLEIMNDDGSIPLSDKEDMLRAIKGQNFQDLEVNELIRKAEKKLRDERLRLEQQESMAVSGEPNAVTSSTQDILNGFFTDLVNNKNYSESEVFINQALKMFENDNVPVLIIISQEGGIVDYDEPTTIRKYLEYLDDTKNNSNLIKNIKLNDAGLITELELIKK